jgi:hypothetical protein
LKDCLPAGASAKDGGKGEREKRRIGEKEKRRKGEISEIFQI